MRSRSLLEILIRAKGRFAFAFLIASVTGTTFADGPPSTTIPPPLPIVVSPPAPPVADKPTGGCPGLSGDSGTLFGVDLLLGQFTGLRGQAAMYVTPNSAVVLEAYYGAILDRLGSGEGAGGGARYYFHRTDRTAPTSTQSPGS